MTYFGAVTLLLGFQSGKVDESIWYWTKIYGYFYNDIGREN